MPTLNTGRRILLFLYAVCVFLATFVFVPWQRAYTYGFGRTGYAPIWNTKHGVVISIGQMIIELIGLTIMFGVFFVLSGPMKDGATLRLVKRSKAQLIARPWISLLAMLAVVISVFAIVEMPRIRRRIMEGIHLNSSVKREQTAFSDEESARQARPHETGSNRTTENRISEAEAVIVRNAIETDPKFRAAVFKKLQEQPELAVTWRLADATGLPDSPGRADSVLRISEEMIQTDTSLLKK